MPKTKTKPVKKSKHCYYALRDHHYDGAWHVVMVYRGKPGYRLVNPDTDLGGPCSDKAEADRCVAYWNKAVGVTPEEAMAIVSGSIRAQNAEEAKSDG